MVNILLTGASRGIGAAARRALAAAGHHVIGQSTAGGSGCITADFAVPRAADALWQQALAAGGGRIDVLVNNAGVFEAADIDDADAFAATWARSHATCVATPYCIFRQAAAGASSTSPAAPAIAATARRTGIMPLPRPA